MMTYSHGIAWRGTAHTRPYCIKSLYDCQNNEAGDSMAVHELAGTKVRKEDYIDLNAIAAAYHSTHPDVTDPHQQVRFGTSGHRGQAGNGSFTEDHVAAITQAVCNFRKQFGAEGPLFVGEDTHYLSKLAYETVLSVLAANGVTPLPAGRPARTSPRPSKRKPTVSWQAITRTSG